MRVKTRHINSTKGTSSSRATYMGTLPWYSEIRRSQYCPEDERWTAVLPPLPHTQGGSCRKLIKEESRNTRGADTRYPWHWIHGDWFDLFTNTLMLASEMQAEFHMAWETCRRWAGCSDALPRLSITFSSESALVAKNASNVSFQWNLAQHFSRLSK